MDNDRIVEIGARALNPSAFDAESNPHRDPKVDAELAKMRNAARETARVVLVRVLLSAFEEAGLVVEQGWQPIETAPKTTKAILVWVPENKCTYEVSWGSAIRADGNEIEGWIVFGGSWRNHIQGPTHWRPLPAPPAAKADPQ